MKPSELRELADWHCRQADVACNIGREKCHTQSALALNFLADVLEAEPAGVASYMPATNGFTMAAFESAKVPAGSELIIKPTLESFGDDK